jgi:hypothetical protein
MNNKMGNKPEAAELGLDWQMVTDQAGWQPRDSQGEAVFGGRMWIMGGWFDSYIPAPRDVWSSADGKRWDLVTETAGWRSSDIPMTLAYRDRIWFMGGWYNGRLPGYEATCEVWSSTDGAEWDRSRDAAWSARMGAGAAVFKDRMWILGGTENYLFSDDDACLRNDVWSSSDGTNWELATPDAGWSPRAFHQAVVLDGKLWIVGGGSYKPNFQVRNDVWCSEDGVRWTRVLDRAPWMPRIWFSAVVYRNRMWVLGGSTLDNELVTDVWHSMDGEHWSKLVSTDVWSPRHEHSAFVLNDRIWVAGGHAKPLNSEVWSLYVPEGWLGEY